MKKIFYLVSLILFLLACNVNTTINNHTLSLDSIKVGREAKSVPHQFNGLYREHTSQFLDCGTGALFVLKNTQLLDSLYNSILPNAYADEAIYVEVNASTDVNDSTVILFTSNLKAEQKNYKNTCITADYWCTGTEPFWQIQISKAEDLIDFYNPMEQKTTHFVYAEPEIKNGVTTYFSSDGENKISIIIKKEKCNGATDLQYDYSVEVNLNNKKFNGCAIHTEKQF